MGRAKAWLEFGPEHLLQRVVRQVAAATDRVVVVAAAGQHLPAPITPARVVRDAARDEGPLRALATGLAMLGGDIELVYVTGTDAPFLHPGWIARLVELARGVAAAIPEVAGRAHPLAALYRRGPTLAAAEALLAAGERRLAALRDRIEARRVDEAALADLDPTFASVRNVNTYEEYLRALEQAGFDPPDDPTGRPSRLSPADRPR